MKRLEIKALQRNELGTKPACDLRRAGRVPCIVFGGGDTVHCSVKKLDLRPLIYTAQSYIVMLDIEGNKESCVLRHIQFDPVSDAPIHIDFFRIIKGKPVEIDIPVQIEGTAEGVKAGGKLFQSLRRVRVAAFEEDLTDSVQVDSSKMKLNDTIFVSDLKLDKIKVLTPGSAVVCSVKMTRAAIGAAATGEEEVLLDEDGQPIEGGKEGAEGADAPAAEGAAK